jgi:hypothetical protein
MSWNFKTNFLKINFLKIQELLAFGSRLHEYIPEYSGKFFYSVVLRAYEIRRMKIKQWER